jgi:hypothetical protein
MEATSQSSGNLSSNSGLDPASYPYLAQLADLQRSYPALKSLLLKLHNHGDRDEGRRLVAQRYEKLDRGIGRAGRCAVLTFEETKVCERMFCSSDDLAEYFKEHPPGLATTKNVRRVYILEDMEPSLVDVLGQQLDVDPLIYSEQLNSWNYCK